MASIFVRLALAAVVFHLRGRDVERDHAQRMTTVEYIPLSIAGIGLLGIATALIYAGTKK